MFLEYQAGHSFLHRLDVRTKLIGFLLIIVAAFLFSHPLYNMVILIGCLLLAYGVKISLQKLKITFFTLLPIVVLIILLSAVSYHPDSFQKPLSRIVLFTFFPGKFLRCTVGGILLGISLSLRIFTLVISSTILTYTTSLDDFLQLLRKVRVSYKISFIITTAIRFIPTMENKAQQIIEAQQARGAQFDNTGLFKRIKAYIPIMIPMIVESLRMSENLAMAMLNRGFGATRQWTVLQEIKARPIDVIMSIIFLAALTFLFFIKAAHYGNL